MMGTVKQGTLTRIQPPVIESNKKHPAPINKIMVYTIAATSLDKRATKLQLKRATINISRRYRVHHRKGL